MQKIMIFAFFCISTLSAMEQPSHEIVISHIQQKDVPAIITLHKQVSDEYFRPAMLAGYLDNPLVQNPETLNKFFNGIDVFIELFSTKAINDTGHNKDCILIASNKEKTDSPLGFCAFIKEESSIFILYLLVSQQARGEGIGKALINSALSMYKDIVVCRLVTLAYGNESTHMFYERLGFTSTKELCTAVECIPNTHIMYQLDIKKT